jgi:hypothetical protein
VRTRAVEYTDELDLAHIIGGVYSALSEEGLPTKDRRPLFEEPIRRSLATLGPYVEEVRVSILVGLSRWRCGRTQRGCSPLRGLSSPRR